MHRNGSGLIKKQDIVLILIFLAAALAAFLWLVQGQGRGKEVEISINGKVTVVYSLAEDRQITIQGTGGSNVLTIRQGKAEMTKADCPDGICVKHKAIGQTGETIVCLPHKVVVEVIGNQGNISQEDQGKKKFDGIAR